MLDKENSLENEEEILSVDQILDNEDQVEVVEECVIVKSEGKVGIFTRLLAEVINQIVVLAMALIGIIAFDLILRVFGFRIVETERQIVFLIIFVIMNIVYVPICESLKIRKTIGKKNTI